MQIKYNMRRSLWRTLMLITSAFATVFAQAATSRPFRVGYFNLNPQLNKQKPLATLEPAGWVINSGILVGAFDNRWVGGLSLATQRVQWWFDGGSDMATPPASFGSNVVLGFRDGKVVKLDALSGEQQWSAMLDAFVDRPLVLHGKTLFAVTASQVLYALDFQSGKTLWVFDGGYPDGLKLRGAARPIVSDGKVIYGLATGELVAVEADSGKQSWRYNPAYNDARFHDVVGEMIVRSGHLIFTRYDGLIARIDLNSSLRSAVWQETTTGIATSFFHNGRIYVAGTNGDISAYDIDSGRRLFRTPNDTVTMTFAASENVLYAAGGNGRITAIDATSGELIWHDQLGNTIATSPVIHEDAIYFMTGQKSVYVYRLNQAIRDN